MRIKICGICSVRDAKVSLEAGADALGFLCGVPQSVRSYISPRKAREIIAAVPPFVSTVLVTTLEEAEAIDDLLRQVPVSHLQLHGRIKPESVRKLKKDHPNVKIIKAVPVSNRGSIAEARRWRSVADALLLDTKTAGSLGGSGVTHDWRISRSIVQAVSLPVILAGGLSPENVREAIHKVKPYGVDVNSGVTSGGRQKDQVKLELFVQRAQEVEV